MDKKITTRAEYDALKAKVEILIAEATAKGCLNPIWIMSTLRRSAN